VSGSTTDDGQQAGGNGGRSNSDLGSTAAGSALGLTAGEMLGALGSTGLGAVIGLGFANLVNGGTMVGMPPADPNVGGGFGSYNTGGDLGHSFGVNNGNPAGSAGGGHGGGGG
jgi:hypothetical protein